MNDEMITKVKRKEDDWKRQSDVKEREQLGSVNTDCHLS